MFSPFHSLSNMRHKAKCANSNKSIHLDRVLAYVYNSKNHFVGSLDTRNLAVLVPSCICVVCSLDTMSKSHDFYSLYPMPLIVYMASCVLYHE